MVTELNENQLLECLENNDIVQGNVIAQANDITKISPKS